MIKVTREMEQMILGIMEQAEDQEMAAAQIAELMMELAYTTMREGKGQPMMEIWRKTLQAAGIEE